MVFPIIPDNCFFLKKKKLILRNLKKHAEITRHAMSQQESQFNCLFSTLRATVHARIQKVLSEGVQLWQRFFSVFLFVYEMWDAPKIVSEYDQKISQSQTADNPVAPRGRAVQPSRDTRKTN